MWSDIVDQYNKNQTASLELLILSVNTRPDLCLEPPPQPMPAGIFNAPVTSTPAATPNQSGSAPSPEPYGTAATPSSGVNISVNPPTPTTEVPAETDSEAQLIDIGDESWAVILSHRVNSSPHSTEYKPALASGYLIRRKGLTDGDSLLAMSVNLLYTQRNSSMYEKLLRETLCAYRGLACLARSKGTRHVQRNTLPWHIATAARGAELLSYVF